MPRWESSSYFTRMLAFNSLLILVIGIVPLAFLFQYMMSAYSSELTNYNVQSVKQIQGIIDEQFLKPAVEAANRSLTESTSADPPLLYPMTHDIRGSYSSLTQVTSALASIEAELSFASSVDLYDRHNGIFFYGAKSFCFVEETDCSLGFREQWLHEFQLGGPQVAWYVTDAADNPDREKLISYLRSYPYFAEPAKRKALFVVNLKESAIRKKLLQALDPSGGLVFVVDGAGGLVTSNGTEKQEAEFREASACWERPAPEGSEEPIAGVKWEGKDAVAAFASSDINDWRYVAVVEKSIFYKRASHLRNFMYGLGAAVLLAGTIAVYMLTKTAHRPIGRKLREYSLQIDDLHDQLAKNEPVIKYHSMMSLLTGAEEAAADGAITDMQRFLGLRLCGDAFLCFALMPSLAAGSGEGTRSGVAAAYRLCERLEQVDRPDCRIWAIVSPEGLIYGIANGADGETIERALLDQADRYAEQPFRLCLGNRYAAAETAPAVSYREACEALGYAYFYPEQTVIRYAALRTAERQVSGGSVKALDDLTDALRAADGGKAHQAIRSVIEETLSERYTADYGRHMLMELVFTLHKALKSMGIVTRELFGCDIRDYAGSLRNVREFAGWIGQAADAALRQIETRRRGMDGGLDERVKAFIEEHLYGELSLDMAAAHIGVTPNYLSRLFKLGTGVTFIDYVTCRKLEAAAALLGENRYTVAEVAQRLGYQSVNHFIRIFKEKYGVTPKQYHKTGFTA